MDCNLSSLECTYQHSRETDCIVLGASAVMILKTAILRGKFVFEKQHSEKRHRANCCNFDTLFASDLEGCKLSASHLRRFPFRRKSKVTSLTSDWRRINIPCLCQGRNSEPCVWVVYTISTCVSIGSRLARISNSRSFLLTNIVVSSVSINFSESTYLRASFT